MRIAFRVDASLLIGAGHVARCMTLANGLRQCGNECFFICRSHEGNLINLILTNGYQVWLLESSDCHNPEVNQDLYGMWLGCDWATDATQTKKILLSHKVDWLVVDHYALDINWERSVKAVGCRLMVIDDLANRHHDCDLLLDQNLGRKHQDYVDLVAVNTKMLIGPKYALLRPEFLKYRNYSTRRRINSELKTLLIAMGGVDNDNITKKVLQTLRFCKLPEYVEITVILGSEAPWLTSVRECAAKMEWHTKVLVGVNNIAEIMAYSDLCIGAAGGTAWERCCLGLPSLMIIIADNQKIVGHALEKIGAARLIGVGNDFESKLIDYFACQARPNSIESMSKKSAQVTDGLGLGRVVDNIYHV